MGNLFKIFTDNSVLLFTTTTNIVKTVGQLLRWFHFIFCSPDTEKRHNWQLVNKMSIPIKSGRVSNRSIKKLLL